MSFGSKIRKATGSAILVAAVGAGIGTELLGAAFNAPANIRLVDWDKYACIPDASKGGTLACWYNHYAGDKPGDANSDKYAPGICNPQDYIKKVCGDAATKRAPRGMFPR